MHECRERRYWSELTPQIYQGLVIMKDFITFSEREILALATSLEEDERVYADLAEGHK